MEVWDWSIYPAFESDQATLIILIAIASCAKQVGRLVLFELLFGSFGLGNIGELLRLQVVQSKTGGQTSVVLSAVSIVELSTELQLCQAKSEQQKYKNRRQN